MRAHIQWRWHLDEVFVRINGEIYCLWRAVDHEGEVLEVFVTKKRDRKAAMRFLRKAMKRYGRPESVVTDKLRSYQAAMKVIGNEASQVTGRWLNNRAENSHQPFRRRENSMAKFRSANSLQKFASFHSSIHNHFNQERHLYNRQVFRPNRAENSHQPFRRRERAMAKFRSAKSLHKFASIHSSVHNHFNLERHLYNRENFKLNRAAAMAEWRQLAI